VEGRAAVTRLSGPQLNRLRYARKRQLFTPDINRGNERRTYATLFKLGMLDWDPLFHGRVVVTALGERQLKESQELERRQEQELPKQAEEEEETRRAWVDWYWYIFGGAPGPHERAGAPSTKPAHSRKARTP
jgi:hypothetical protein